MKEKNGINFINRIYKNLYKSMEVRHNSYLLDSPSLMIKKYMERLDNIHKMVNKKHREKLIKELYYEKYIIKRRMLANYTDEKRKEIIRMQEESLNIWIDYLINDCKYPMWIKYWIFQGMIKIGNYDEGNNLYYVRSKKTIAPFIRLDKNVLEECIDLLIEYIDRIPIDDIDMYKLIDNGNFRKLYTMLLIKEQEVNKIKDNYNGEWIKYNYKNMEDADRLYESLQEYNTGWCTGKSRDIARGQICGSEVYCGGDFYVYYTKNDLGEYKVPRIAIRMQEDKNILEIRGIDKGQNLEDGFEKIIYLKLEEMNVSNKDKYINYVRNAMKINKIRKKIALGEELLKEDYLFIYQDNIETFGMENDLKIDDLRKKMIINDYEIALEVVRNNGYALEYVDDKIKGIDIELAAINENYYALKYASKELRKNEKILLDLVKQGKGSVLIYANEKIRNKASFMLKVIKIDSNLLEYVGMELRNNIKFMKLVRMIINLNEGKKKIKVLKK